MGGLLDKANAAKEPETDDKPLEVEPAPVVQQKHQRRLKKPRPHLRYRAPLTTRQN